MAIIYAPQYKLTVNGFDVSATVSPYLISINLEDAFDNDFTVSKLELIFNAKYKRSSSWQYKDQLKIELWWLPYPTFKYISNTFYVDYVEDVKNAGGNQFFRVSALEADPSLGFTYSTNVITLTNKTTIQAVTDFATLFGLTVSQNMTANVYMGTIKNILGSPTPSLTTITATFNSYAEMLKYICKTYGYFGNLSGKNLQIYSINSTFSNTTRFFMPSFGDAYDLSSKQTYNKINKVYADIYINRAASNTITRLTFSPAMSAQLNNKSVELEYTDAYYNIESGGERLYGAAYQDFYAGFEIVINCSALPEMSAGKIFQLDSTYGFHEGYYRCTRVIHKVDGNGWNVEVTGFPLNILQAVSASFNLGYVSRYQNPPLTRNIRISQAIRGTTTGLTAAMLDNYAKYFNPNYSLALGSIFIGEGNKTANSIRPDIAFCLAMYLTNNFLDNLLVTRFNPGELNNAANTDINTFANWTTGIRAMIQQMFAFATTTGSPADTIVAPRYSSVTRGSATTIDALQAKWNTDLDLSSTVKEKVKQLYIFLNPNYYVYYID